MYRYTRYIGQILHDISGPSAIGLLRPCRDSLGPPTP